MKSRLINWSLSVLSIAFCLALGEGILRLLYEPVDVLSPELVPDDILGHRIDPSSGGHDQWGFRNLEVPEDADIVVIGDSQTWGVNAGLKSTFPSRLHEIVHRSVYNMGVSGYGPVQYQHLLETKALALDPELIVVGLYLGNDFDDAFKLVYLDDDWKLLRSTAFAEQKEVTPDNAVAFTQQAMYGFRYWLNHNSVFYRVAKNSFASVFNTSIRREDAVHYKNEHRNIDKYFFPRVRMSVIDHDSPRIREGLRISLERLSKMNEFCVERGVNFVVVLIPTDIMVYSEYLTKESVKDRNLFNNVVHSEDLLKRAVLEMLIDKRIAHVDVLDSLKAHTSDVIYPKYEDGHPSPLGYSIIAKAVAAGIERNGMLEIN